MSKFEKFSEVSIEMKNIFGGASSDSTGDCHGTGCTEDSSGDGKIKDWEDAECGDTTVGTNSGTCNPSAISRATLAVRSISLGY